MYVQSNEYDLLIYRENEYFSTVQINPLLKSYEKKNTAHLTSPPTPHPCSRQQQHTHTYKKTNKKNMTQLHPLEVFKLY